MYAKNTVDFNGGELSALTSGETAVKAKLGIGNAVTEADTLRAEGLTDYVIVEVPKSKKEDLEAKIEDAKRILSDNDDKSEEKKSALSNAISDAENVLNDPSSTDDSYTAAVTRLQEAIANFNRNGGTHSPAGIGGTSGGILRKYNVTVVDTANGRVEVSQDKVVKGNSLTISANPDDGYTVADMQINGKSVGRNEVYTIPSVDKDIEVKVIFAEKSDLPFDDVIESDWYYPYVKTAYNDGLMRGISDTRFEPESALTRAMFVTILHRFDGSKTEGNNVFADVAEDAYYKDAVAWANANGIVLGISDNEFAPDENITREQIAAILYRYAKYMQYDTSADGTNIDAYSDCGMISDYAVDAMKYAVGTGIVNGKSETLLAPLDNATRAEAATIFVRFAEVIK